MKWLENTIEWLIFQSRWLLAPVYLGLVAALALLSFKFLQELVSYAPTIITSSSDDTILAVLSLVDLVLVGNLIILVIFAGYENFVSKIDIANQSEDKPEWMGKLDFSGLKLKLIASIVAISSIGLLEAFIDVGSKTSEEIYLMIFIHAVFILSGLVIAIMDYISGITKHHP